MLTLTKRCTAEHYTIYFLGILRDRHCSTPERKTISFYEFHVEDFIGQAIVGEFREVYEFMADIIIDDVSHVMGCCASMSRSSSVMVMF